MFRIITSVQKQVPQTNIIQNMIYEIVYKVGELEGKYTITQVVLYDAALNSR